MGLRYSQEGSVGEELRQRRKNRNLADIMTGREPASVSASESAPDYTKRPTTEELTQKLMEYKHQRSSVNINDVVEKESEGAFSSDQNMMMAIMNIAAPLLGGLASSIGGIGGKKTSMLRGAASASGSAASATQDWYKNQMNLLRQREKQESALRVKMAGKVSGEIKEPLVEVLTQEGSMLVPRSMAAGYKKLKAPIAVGEGGSLAQYGEFAEGETKRKWGGPVKFTGPEGLPIRVTKVSDVEKAYNAAARTKWKLLSGKEIVPSPEAKKAYNKAVDKYDKRVFPVIEALDETKKVARLLRNIKLTKDGKVDKDSFTAFNTAVNASILASGDKRINEADRKVFSQPVQAGETIRAWIERMTEGGFTITVNDMKHTMRILGDHNAEVLTGRVESLAGMSRRSGVPSQIIRMDFYPASMAKYIKNPKLKKYLQNKGEDRGDVFYDKSKQKASGAAAGEKPEIKVYTNKKTGKTLRYMKKDGKWIKY